MVYLLYILYENGEIFLIYISLLYSFGNIGKLLGLLFMYFVVEDNYGYDVCVVFCLFCVFNILVIVIELGMLYYCVVLEGEEEDDYILEKFWDFRIDFIFFLYVFECVELEFVLKLVFGEDDFFDFDFFCLVKFYRDFKCFLRYYCIYEVGVYSVGLIWIYKFYKFFGLDEEDKDSL